MQIFEQTILAVCDCVASVSCLSPKIYDTLQTNTKIELSTCGRKLRAANGLPIEVRGVICLEITHMRMIFVCSSDLKQIVC